MTFNLKESPVVKGKSAAWYAKHYYEVEDDINLIFERMDTPFLDKRLKPGMKVFDGMMGRGRHAVRYANRGCYVWGNDLNEHMVEIARKAAQSLHLSKKDIRFTELDVCKLKGVPSGMFDASIAMYSAIGTVPKRRNRQRGMQEMSRVTKKGGIVIIHAHNRLDAFFEKDFLGWALKTTFLPDKGLERGDIIADYNRLTGMFNHFYTPGELRAEFARAGLDVVEEHYMDYHAKRFIKGPLRKFKADGFIFVGKKR